MTLRLLLARHGQTADNARRVFQGQGGHGLNELGRSQAERLGERLRTSPWRPHAIVTSDLERAVETTRIVSARCGVPFEVDPALREIDVGAWTGKPFDEIARDFPSEWSAWQQGLDVRRGDGETYAELAERIHAAIERIAARFGPSARATAQPVLVVFHGAAIRGWVAKILGVSVSQQRALAVMNNAAITIVDKIDDDYRLDAWNDASHIEDLIARSG